jgi:hypothetical protein
VLFRSTALAESITTTIRPISSPPPNAPAAKQLDHTVGKFDARAKISQDFQDGVVELKVRIPVRLPASVKRPDLHTVHNPLA